MHCEQAGFMPSHFTFRLRQTVQLAPRGNMTLNGFPVLLEDFTRVGGAGGGRKSGFIS